MTEEQKPPLPIEPNTEPLETEEKEEAVEKIKSLPRPYRFPQAVFVGPLRVKPLESDE